MDRKILIIGAGGFIGGFIAAESLRRGYETWVAVRASTSRRYLSDERLRFVVLDWDDEESLAASLRGALPQGERWDYMIYNLGATKCIDFMGFNKVNFEYLRTFAKVLVDNDLVPGKFLYMSSLSALGPGDEVNYTPLDSKTIPAPDTRYGVSKIKAETALEMLPGFPWIIFRPTGVYGPHEQDYLMMVKSIDSHFDFGVGYKRQMLTFIYVDDLVRAMFMALESPSTLHHKYIISEDASYSQAEFRKIVAAELGGKWVIPVRLPLWMAYAASVVAEKVGMIRCKPSTLNRDKFKIMKQRNWSCDVTDAERDFGFKAQVSLREGIRRTVAAYRQEKAAKGGRS